MNAPKKYTYFLSDFHLGIPNHTNSQERERKIVRFLNEIEHSCACLYLLGDIFDFWFEYKKVIPKGFTRLLGTLSLMRDRGIPIYYFAGNHDLWMGDYLNKECGITVFFTPQIIQINEKTFMIAHGDGLGPKENAYKCLKKIFRNKILQWLFATFLHPNCAIQFGLYFSRKSYQNQQKKKQTQKGFLGLDKENLALFALDILAKKKVDFFVFGHRHIPIIIPLTEKTLLCNTGDWITHFSYCTFDGTTMKLHFYAR